MILLPRWETVWSQADTSNGLCCCARCISLAGYIVQHACSAAAACSTCHELTRWKYVLKHVRACKLQNVIKTLSQYMQLARPWSYYGLCSVYESNAHVESKALYDTRKQTSIESFNFLHTSPVRYQRFFFFDVRRPEISSQIFRNEKNISWCHQHICN